MARCVSVVAIVAALWYGIGTAAAQSAFPSRPVHIFVPYAAGEVWWGLLGPGGMPRDLVERLAEDFNAALNTEAVKERLSKLGATAIGSSPEAFDARIHADYEKWGPIIEAAGIKAE